MTYLITAVVLALLALAVLMLALRLLVGTRWLAWLRGTFGLAVLALAVAIALVAWSLHGYSQADDKPVATLAFHKLGDKHYALMLTGRGGAERRYELNGDMWQLDLHVLRWPDTLAQLGLKPGYRFDRVVGRYLSFEDEQKLPHSVIALDTGAGSTGGEWLDAWHLLQQGNPALMPLQAVAASAAFQPMVDGAIYSVSLRGRVLAVQPLNETARLAMQDWQ